MAGQSTSEALHPLRRDLATSITPSACTVVLFGATGDLARRKLIPGLYNLAREGFLPPGFTPKIQNFKK